jgi:hypothetical protein
LITYCKQKKKYWLLDSALRPLETCSLLYLLFEAYLRYFIFIL